MPESCLDGLKKKENGQGPLISLKYTFQQVLYFR